MNAFKQEQTMEYHYAIGGVSGTVRRTLFGDNTRGPNVSSLRRGASPVTLLGWLLTTPSALPESFTGQQWFWVLQTQSL